MTDYSDDMDVLKQKRRGKNLSMQLDFQEENQSREKWSRKIEYILSVIGCLVGFGNIWRFPYLCMRNGGGAFLIPFIIFLVLCGVPMVCLECYIGQYSGKPLTKVYEMCPLFKGLGIGAALITFNMTLYYNALLGWITYYLFKSFWSPLPWVTCGNSWNTKGCIQNVRTVIGNSNSSFEEYFNSTKLHRVNSSFSENLTVIVNNTTRTTQYSAAEEYWRLNVLQISSGLYEVGSLNLHTVICTFVSLLVAYIVLSYGIKSVGKVVYVTATLPYVMLTVILIRGLTLPGSADGIIFYLKPDFTKLLSIQIWVEAALQVFVSLAPGWGVLITLSSFNKLNNNFIKDAVLFSFLGEGTSLYGGFAIFSILGHMAYKMDVPLSEVVQSGPGLGFVAYASGLAELPIPNLWAFIFFFGMFTVGLDSHFANMECWFDVIEDIIPVLKRKRVIGRGFMCIALYLIGLIFCAKGGMYVYQLADWFVAAIGPFIVCLLECLIIGWLYGIDRASSDMFLMIGRGVPLFMNICWRFITPIIVLGLVIACCISYKPPSYGSYTYPWTASVFGWLFAIYPLIPVPIYMAMAIKQAPGNSLRDKIRHSLRPSETWTPSVRQEDYICTVKNDKQPIA